MNRRNFIRGLLTIGAGFSILPGAGRIWRVKKEVVKTIYDINPKWVNAPYEVRFLFSYDCVDNFGRPIVPPKIITFTDNDWQKC